jgi:hypothetical protein
VTPPHLARDDSGMVNDIILFRRSPPSPSCERLMNPMLLEAHLMFQKQGIEGGASTPYALSVATPPLKKPIRQFCLEVK